MPSTTPIYGLPYPNTTDQLKAAVKDIPQSLATQLETTLQGFGGIANPGSWQTPTLTAGTNLGSPFALVRYRKIGNRVELRGTLNAGAGIGAASSLFTLPTGFRPPSASPGGTLIFLVASSNGASRVDVASNGTVLVNAAVASGGYISVDGINFDID